MVATTLNIENPNLDIYIHTYIYINLVVNGFSSEVDSLRLWKHLVNKMITWVDLSSSGPASDCFLYGKSS